MAILFRIDVDKPFGHHNLKAKVMSKLWEDFEIIFRLGTPYLAHCKAMIRYLTLQKVSGFFYFRNCTAPDAETIGLLREGNHLLGFHAEDTRNIDTFKLDIARFNAKGHHVSHFTKHGSGKLKLGKRHYPPYEPEKYLHWAKALNLRYFSGHLIPESAKQLVECVDGFWPYCFWIERHYRNPHFAECAAFLDAASENDVVLLTHPENYFTDPILRNDLSFIIEEAGKRSIRWKEHIPETFHAMPRNNT